MWRRERQPGVERGEDPGGGRLPSVGGSGAESVAAEEACRERGTAGRSAARAPRGGMAANAAHCRACGKAAAVIRYEVSEA